jgi:hypothetical protein
MAALYLGLWDRRTWTFWTSSFVGHLDGIVYRDPPIDMEDLTANFHAAVTTIDADMLRRVQASITRHAVTYRRMHGGHFEHLL